MVLEDIHTDKFFQVFSDEVSQALLVKFMAYLLFLVILLISLDFYSPRRNIRISYFGHACPKLEIGNFVSISRLIRSPKIKKNFAFLVYEQVHTIYCHLKKPK